MLKRMIPFLLILMLVGCGSSGNADESSTANGSTPETEVKEEAIGDTVNTITVGDYTADVPSSWINSDQNYYLKEEGKPPMIQAYLQSDQSMSDVLAFKELLVSSILGEMENGEIVSGFSEVQYDQATGYTFSVKGGIQGYNDPLELTITLFENPSGGIVFFNMMDTGNENLPQYTALLNTVHTDVPFNTEEETAGAGSGNTVDSNEIADLIDIKYEPTADGCLCVFIQNNSEVIVDDLDIQALFKDDAGVTISTDSDGHDMILPGATVVSRIETPDEYADVVFEKNVRIGVNPRYENHSAEVQLDAHDGSDGIIVEITNNSDVSIDEVEYVVVYYQGDQLVSVSYDQDVYDIESGKTVTEEVSPWGIEYDRYELYLNQAHTFGL